MTGFSRSQRWPHELIRFLLVGFSAALIHWVLRIALTPLLGFEGAVLASFFGGLAIALILNHVWVFPFSRVPLRSQVSRFIAINLVSLPFIWVMSLVLVEVLSFISDTWWRESIAHGAAIGIPSALNFLAYKFYAFK